MHKTQGISYPRSGHGVLYRALQCYFGDELVYCDPESTIANPSLCACGHVPCVNPANTFAKNHDFGLMHGPGLAVLPDRRYLIQFRSPIRSIASNFHLSVARLPDTDNRYGWTTFIYKQIEYWNAFIDKWVLATEGDRRFLTCRYEDLVSDPFATLRRVIEHVSQEPPSDDRISSFLCKVQVRPLDRLREFDFYDEEFFSRIEALTGDRMTRLGLPPFDRGV